MQDDPASAVEYVRCPLCGGESSLPWAEENGFVAVKCTDCALIYVNPRPVSARIDAAVRTGAHRDEELQLNVVGHRVAGKIAQYRRIVGSMFADVMKADRPIRWLDVGAGFGEVVEAVQSIAPSGSCVEGVEPMSPKASFARARGLRVREGYLHAENDGMERYGFVSAINVFSHVPDFRQFLEEIKRVLVDSGEVLIETGNASDIGERKNFPDQLTLPDHLVFAGEAQMHRFLSEAGFDILQTRRERIDHVFHFAKTVVKRLLGRPVVVSLPYMSPTRTLLIRARLRPS